MSKQFKFLDLSGYMFSGKAALSDLLREFAEVHVPNYRLEFDLLRVSGGLIDLRNAVDDWSPIRTHSALNRFENTIRKLASTPSFPQKFFSTGYGYARIYPNIIENLEQFIEESVVLEWETPWPYDDLEDGAWDTFVRKLSQKLGKNKSRQYRLTSPDVFYPAAQRFVHRILTSELDIADNKILVTHNALEPFDPGQNLVLLGQKAQCIVVDRDPRDIYATAITSQQGFNDNLEFYKRIAGAHNIGTFIKRYNLYRSMIKDSSERVLRITFEDLVNNYSVTLDNICYFLDLSRDEHKEQYKYFDPKRSKSNMELWKRTELKPFQDDFKRIFEQCIQHSCDTTL
jgi:hypothetical protein